MIRLLAPVLLSACAAPDTSAMFTTLEATVATTADDANGVFLDVIDGAQTELRIALPALTDPVLTDAIIEAWNRGVDVGVVVDIDNRLDEGVARLLAENIPTALADDGISYFEFSLNQEVTWTSEQTKMTHAFAVADITQVAMASEVGTIDDAPRVLFSGASEELGEDLLAEHNQLFGGSDAVSKTAFDASAKSVADIRWLYPTQSDELFELWLGPQERVVKRIIDAVYFAKASIRVMTEDFADEGLARALQQKAEDGFDIEVIVGKSFQSTNPSISAVLLAQAPDVSVLQSSSEEPLPTALFIDFDRSPHDGRFHLPFAMVATHPIYSAARLYNAEEVVTDQLCDGALYVLSTTGAPTAPLQGLAQLYLDARATAEAL